MKIAAIVLSAGASTRMTGYKQLLQYKGAPFLQRLFKTLETINLEKIICVTGELHQELIDLSSSKNISFVRNINYKNGMLSTIQLGLSEIIQEENYDAVLICLSDQPLIPLAHYERIIKEAEESDKTIICSSYNETFGPPLLFKTEHYNEILQLQGKSAKPFIKKNKSEVHFIDCDEAGKDIDTDEDYQKLIEFDGK